MGQISLSYDASIWSERKITPLQLDYVLGFGNY